MHVRIDLTPEAEEELRRVLGPDLNGAAKEALLIQSYRTGRVSLSFVAKALGLSTSFEAHRWLADRGVPLNYDLDELESDRKALRFAERAMSRLDDQSDPLRPVCA